MKTIVIANQKGGIGKTTTATNMAAILNDLGHKTLLIDTDLQGNTTDTFKGEIEGAATLYDVLLEESGKRIPMKEAIQKTERGDIVASDPLLGRADDILKNDIEGMFILKDALEEMSKETDYEYVILDTQPSLGAMLQGSLVAADRVIIPVTADRYALQGLSQLMETIGAIKRRHNPDLEVSGILLVKFNGRTRLGREVKEFLEGFAEENGITLFKRSIRESTKTKEAQAMRTPLIYHDRWGNTSLDYIAFVKEFLSKEEYYNGKEQNK